MPVVRVQSPLATGFLQISLILTEGHFALLCLGQGTSFSSVSLQSGVNEYPVGQRWQNVQYVPRELWHMNDQIQ